MTFCQLKLSPEQSGKVEYERERLLGIANKLMNLLAIPSSLSRSYSTFPLCSGDNLNWNSCIHNFYMYFSTHAWLVVARNDLSCLHATICNNILPSNVNHGRGNFDELRSYLTRKPCETISSDDINECCMVTMERTVSKRCSEIYPC
jgi:hypothetical protein